MSWTKLPCLSSLLIFQGAIRNFEPSPLAPSCLPAFSCSQPLRGIRMPPIFFWIWINLDNIQVTQTYYQLTWNTPKKNQLVYRWFFNPLPLSQGVAPRPQPYKGSLGLCRDPSIDPKPSELEAFFKLPKLYPSWNTMERTWDPSKTRKPWDFLRQKCSETSSNIYGLVLLRIVDLTPFLNWITKEFSSIIIHQWFSQHHQPHLTGARRSCSDQIAHGTSTRIIRGTGKHDIPFYLQDEPGHQL